MSARSCLNGNKLAALIWGLYFCHIGTSAQQGFVSLDCGGAESYVDSLGIEWIPDQEYIKTAGEFHSISSDLMANFSKSLHSLRSFPNNIKSCYKVPTTQGTRYLIRSSFLYGNYDNKNDPPSFELIIEANLIANISTSVTEVLTKTYIFIAKKKSIDVCVGKRLVQSTPFISCLELRTLSSNMYQLMADNKRDFSGTFYLEAAFQLNYGADSSTPIVRYPDDVYDRIWSPVIHPTYERMPTSTNLIDTEPFYNYPPIKVLRTGIFTENKIPLTVAISGTPRAYKLYYSLSMEDSRDRSIDDICAFSVHGNNIQKISGDKVTKGVSFMEFGNENFTTGSVNFTLMPTQNSTLGPFLSAIDIQLMVSIQNGTHAQDVTILEEVKEHFGLDQYGGDPCLPRDYAWDWITCNMDTTPRIIAIDLSNRKLNGTVTPTLADLEALRSLNLADNNLTGKVPQELLQNTFLDTDFSGNPYLCMESSCNVTILSPSQPPSVTLSSPNNQEKRKLSLSIIIGAVVAASVIVALTISLVVIFRCCQNKGVTISSEGRNTADHQLLYHVEEIGGEATTFVNENDTNQFNRCTDATEKMQPRSGHATQNL